MAAQELFDGAKRSMKNGNYVRATELLEEIDTRYPFGRISEQAKLELIYAYFKRADYESGQALADRFVEAFAEYLHRVIRTDMWGYAPDEQLNEADLLKIKYDGIRPAPGYPSQPDHTEKRTMWNAIQAKELAGIDLSDSLSMMPAASVSALVFAHPESQYFAVGQIGKDQVESYASRKKMDLEVCERWLSPILNYERS